MILRPGDLLPDVALSDQNGSTVRTSDLRGKKVVIFFYPRDNTPVCTQESCRFRDEYERFQHANAEVFGVSSDNIESHLRFAQSNQLPYRLLSDPKREMARAFGVPQRLGLLPARVTFTVDSSGVIQHVTHADMSANRHVDEALDALQKLA